MLAIHGGGRHESGVKSSSRRALRCHRARVATFLASCGPLNVGTELCCEEARCHMHACLHESTLCVSRHGDCCVGS